MRQLDHAIKVALAAHDGQIDKIGRPYFEHCRRVALAVSGDDAKSVAYLHDVVEKSSGWTLERLAQDGFSQTVVSAVDALTRWADETDDAYVRRAASNRLALPVKQADLEDNLWQVYQTGGDADKYRHGLAILREYR